MKNLPDKIYVTSDENNAFVFTKKRTDNAGAEYIRKDAFVEKACEFLKDHLAGYDICEDDIERSVESFKLVTKLWN